MIRSTSRGLLAAFLLSIIAAPAAADVLEDNLSAYADGTAEGYLKPLQESLGQALNSNFSTTARIPTQGFYVKFEISATNVRFKGSDKTFEASTGSGFSPSTTAKVSTVVGPENATIVDGSGGTQFVFPGGFNLSSLSFGIPQLTVGSLKGTEAIFRWVLIPTQNEDINDLTFFGIGARHSISQYLQNVDVDLAGDFFYQNMSTSGDFLDLNTWSFGVSTGKPFGVITSYGRVGFDITSMKAQYTAITPQGDTPETLDMKSESTLHLTAGVALGLGPVGLAVSGDWAQRFQFGAAFLIQFGGAR